MRRALTPAIPPSMYRHFAVVTVLLTTALALFAEGENSESRAALVVRQQPAPAPVARPTLAPPAPDMEARAGAGYYAASGGSDFDSGFGRPLETLFDGGGSILPSGDLAAEAGYSPEYLASLSPEEREMLLKGLQENGMLSPEVRESRARALEAASRRRSGSVASDA